MPEAHDTDLTTPADLARRFHALSCFDHIIVAVSGGSDSIALLRLLDLWVTAIRPDRPNIQVATVDHDLREGSADEAAFVANVAGALGYRHRTLVWRGSKPKSGVQELAREARYSLLLDVAAEFSGDSVILTAHTQDDQAETMLMRLARGSGPDGLSSIPARTSREGVVIARPLLDATKVQLKAFLKSVNQDWREDPSNTLTEFERIRVRTAQPARQQLALSDKALAQTAQRMQRARHSLELIAQDLLQTVAEGQNALHFGVFEWRSDMMGRFGAEVGIRCLRRVVHVIGAQTARPNLSQIERLYETLAENGFRGTTLHGARFIMINGSDRQRLFIFRETGRLGLRQLDLTPGMDALWDGRFAVRAGPELSNGFNMRALRQEDLSELQIPTLDHIPASLRTAILLTLPAVWQGSTLLGVPHFNACHAEISVDVAQIKTRLCN